MTRVQQQLHKNAVRIMCSLCQKFSGVQSNLRQLVIIMLTFGSLDRIIETIAQPERISQTVKREILLCNILSNISVTILK